MEEKKLNPKNQVKKEATETKQKLSYEQLNDACAQLYQQNQNLVKQLQQTNMVNMFKRLDYLFKVLEFSNLFDEKFVKSCVEEVKEAITITPEETKEEEEG